MTSKSAAGNDIGQRNDPDHVAACLNLSHEMRTPANVILGQVELLLTGSAGPLTSEMRASLGDIQRAAIGLSTQIVEVIGIAESLVELGSASTDRQ
ncbi:MAG: histidine kinase dimerization/phospho-acceptor domain-containing protein [Geminicoccaceae bacterium]